MTTSVLSAAVMGGVATPCRDWNVASISYDHDLTWVASGTGKLFTVMFPQNKVSRVSSAGVDVDPTAGFVGHSAGDWWRKVGPHVQRLGSTRCARDFLRIILSAGFSL